MCGWGLSQMPQILLQRSALTYDFHFKDQMHIQQERHLFEFHHNLASTKFEKMYCEVIVDLLFQVRNCGYKQVINKISKVEPLNVRILLVFARLF